MNTSDYLGKKGLIVDGLSKAVLTGTVAHSSTSSDIQRAHRKHSEHRVKVHSSWKVKLLDKTCNQQTIFSHYSNMQVPFTGYVRLYMNTTNPDIYNTWMHLVNAEIAFNIKPGPCLTALEKPCEPASFRSSDWLPLAEVLGFSHTSRLMSFSWPPALFYELSWRPRRARCAKFNKSPVNWSPQ